MESIKCNYMGMWNEEIIGIFNEKGTCDKGCRQCQCQRM